MRGAMSSPTRSGFSLVEALVAVVLAGGGIAALVSAIGATTRGESKAIQSEKMQRLAVQKLDEVIATQEPHTARIASEYAVVQGAVQSPSAIAPSRVTRQRAVVQRAAPRPAAAAVVEERTGQGEPG